MLRHDQGSMYCTGARSNICDLVNAVLTLWVPEVDCRCFNAFHHQAISHGYGERHVCLNMYFFSKIKTNMTNFHPLEVVGRGSETQLQVGKKLSR